MGNSINNFTEKGHKFNYEWSLKDAIFTKDKGSVFSCFSCGGGSTMGYKLAGFDVIGCNEIDPKMMEAYRKNHNPKYSFLEPIQTFKLRQDLPQELFELDILDGSPPCSSFSMSGNREGDWGKGKKFREGQAIQVLDTLFFDFIDLAKKLQPKVVIAENVKGILFGKAKNYVIQIHREFDLAGYYVQHFILDSSKMGVPQKRERVFFIALRKDLAGQFLKQLDFFTIAPELNLVFNEHKIPFHKIEREFTKIHCEKSEHVYPSWSKWVEHCEPGKDFSSIKDAGKSKMFNCCKVSRDLPIPTITARFDGSAYFTPENRHLNLHEFILASTFPLDYDFNGMPGQYLIGMSVPPVMTAQVASKIYDQWLSKI